uniref:Uncharacterized protein n=1 Tax=Ciona savignyi TaxID=51511 RepID=H2YKS4_CIOSA
MESLERTLAVWGWQNYGPVFFFTRGSCRTVVLNTYEAASEGFVKQGNHLSGRFDPKHKHKLFADYTEKWQEQRKLRVMALKGLGKINLEEVISSECGKLMEKIKEMGCGFEAGYLLATPTFNVIRKVIYGETAGKGNSYEDKLSKILSGPVYDVEGGVWRALVDLFPQVRSSLTFERMVEKKVKERIDKVREQITGSQEFMDEMLQKIQDWENGECYND